MRSWSGKNLAIPPISPRRILPITGINSSRALTGVHHDIWGADHHRTHVARNEGAMRHGQRLDGSKLGVVLMQLVKLVTRRRNRPHEANGPARRFG